MNSLDAFEELLDSLSEEERERLLLSINYMAGFSGVGPTMLDNPEHDQLDQLDLSENQLQVVHLTIEKEKAWRQKIFKASTTVALGEVEDENGFGTRYATEEETNQAKEILNIQK